MIKQLMNKSYVPSSSKAQAAEELVKGALKLYLETISKHFNFSFIGIDFDPLYIDPVNRAIMNVQFLNDVDISKLIGGVTEGYGITIDSMGKGVYKINVKEGMFALKSELDNVDAKFDNYTTTADLEANYATKAKVEEIDAKFTDYTTTTDLQANYATKAKVEEIDAKFADYTTTADLEANYATKAKVDAVDNKFANYTSTIDLEAKYATKAKVEEIDAKFDNYTTTTDLEANYMKKGDVNPTEAQFDEVTGFIDYYVKNEHLSQETANFNDNSALGDDISGWTEQDLILKTEYNKLTITPPSDIRNSIVYALGKRDVFKIIFRKNVIYDLEGTYTKEFVIYTDNHKVYCPIITLDQDGPECKINYAYLVSNEFFIACDTKLSFNPFSLYKEGNLSIMYLLNQDSLVAKKPTIKCDIIDARNVLRLHESDVHYFYKPNIITEETIDYTYRDLNPETSQMENVTVKIDCYKMVYKLPSDYQIPDFLNFKFIEHCFGNEWSLRWTGTEWSGYNVQGRSNGKIESSKQYLRVDKEYNDYGMSGCFIRCKHDDWNGRFLGGTSGNLMKVMFSYGKTMLLYKDGTLEEASKYMLDIDRYLNVDAYSKEGYDYLPVYLRINNSNEGGLISLLNKTEIIYLDMTINGALNRLSFRWDKWYQDQNFGFYIDLIPELDSIERVNVYWNYTKITPQGRDIELYLRKDYTDPIEEVNWDNSTNAFDYIIQQQFYEITPNPNAATTLYTDYNITSSKIITADNITTMRSDLNLVTNTVDVVSYDVKDIKDNVETLNSKVAEQAAKTKYLEEAVDNIDMKANIGIALGAAGCVIGATGLGVAGKALSFASKGATQAAAKGGGKLVGAISNFEHAEKGEMILEDISGTGVGKVLGDGSKFLPAIPIKSVFALRSTEATDLTPILEWCDKEYSSFDKITFDDELDDPDCNAITLTSALELNNRFRCSLKPTFKLLATRINEISDNIDITINDKLNSYATATQLAECVKIYDLVRNDTIDIFANVDNEHHILMLQFEDNIIEGLIVFKTFAVSGSNTRQRRFYIKIADGRITDYKGVQENTTIDGIEIKPLAQSESDRVNYMPNAELVMDTTERFISISIDANYLISGAVIETCTCTRQMVYSTSDLAYIQDIEALNKKIDALAEQSHMNDIQTLSMRDDYATIDEVNTALTNYVQIKDMPPVVDLNGYYTKAEVDEMINDFDEGIANEFYNKNYMDENFYYIFIANETFASKRELTNYTLKAENDELKAKIAELENKINNTSWPDISCLFTKILVYSSLNRYIAYNEDDIQLYIAHYVSYQIDYNVLKGRITISYDLSLKSLIIQLNSITSEDKNMKCVYQDTSLKKHLVEWHITFRTEDLEDNDMNKRFVRYDFNDIQAYKQNELLINPGQTLPITVPTDSVPVMYNDSINIDYFEFYRLPTDFDFDYN